jgi:hypothetical protein
MSRNFGYARLVRINDEDTLSYEEGLESCAWHFGHGKQLSRKPAGSGPGGATRATSWPYRGFRLVAAGCHGGKGLVMFGVCQSLAWVPYSDGKRDRYKSSIDVAWEDLIAWIEPGNEPTQPLPRSNMGIDLAEYTAWRTRAVPFKYASTLDDV